MRADANAALTGNNRLITLAKVGKSGVRRNIYHIYGGWLYTAPFPAPLFYFVQQFGLKPNRRALNDVINYSAKLFVSVRDKGVNTVEF
jgi:hypothetical protein